MARRAPATPAPPRSPPGTERRSGDMQRRARRRERPPARRATISEMSDGWSAIHARVSSSSDSRPLYSSAALRDCTIERDQRLGRRLLLENDIGPDPGRQRKRDRVGRSRCALSARETSATQDRFAGIALETERRVVRPADEFGKELRAIGRGAVTDGGKRRAKSARKRHLRTEYRTAGEPARLRGRRARTRQKRRRGKAQVVQYAARAAPVGRYSAPRSRQKRSAISGSSVNPSK